MSQIAPLNAKDHYLLWAQTNNDGHRLRVLMLGLSELAQAAANFPLCLAKDEQTGRFNLIALSSLVDARNLFWHDGRWLATYVPESANTAPFLIDPNGLFDLAVDQSAIMSTGDSFPLFDAEGQPNPLLEGVSMRLKHIINDVNAAQVLVDRLVTLKVVRPIRCMLKFAHGKEHEINGLFNVSHQAIASLDNDTVLDLHRTGALAVMTILQASMAQFERLRHLHNMSSKQSIVQVIAALID